MKLGTLLTLVLLLLLWAVLLRPTYLGGPMAYTLVAGRSMEPEYKTGDLVISRKASEYAPGDVIAFQVPEGEADSGKRVIHRIIGGNGQEGYVTQGDNNTWLDPWQPTSGDVLGKQWLHVKGGAEFINALRSPQVFVSSAMFLAALGWFTGRRMRPIRRTQSALITQEV